MELKLLSMINTVGRKLLTFGLTTGLLLSALQVPVIADESSSKLRIPEPAVFLTPEAVSLTVVRARPEDEGFKSLFDTAWKSLSGSGGIGSNVLYKAILLKIQGSNSNAFSSLLPAQFVRVDSLPSGTDEPHPTTVTTISGWPGLQQLWYMTQDKGGSGEKFEQVELDGATLILRDGYENPANGRVLTRLDGSIVSFPSEQRARYAVSRFEKKDTSSPNKEFGALLSAIDTSHDTYGVVINQRGSMLKLLRWLNKGDVAQAEAQVGKERIADVFEQVKSMTWEGDLISDDECKFILHFKTTSPEARIELTKTLKDVRNVLDSYGRAGKMETSGLDNELYVNFVMTGYRGMMVSYIERYF